LDDATRQAIAKAKAEFDSMCSGLSVSSMQVPGFGKKDCKKGKVSPDAVMQLAFQVGTYLVF